MVWFFKKRDDVLDLSERYKKQQERIKELKQEAKTSPGSESSPVGFGIFGMSSTTTTTTSDSGDSGSGYAESADEKRRKLAKRLMDITDKIEDLSNQIYHIQQRLEVIEKKLNPGTY